MESILNLNPQIVCQHYVIFGSIYNKSCNNSTVAYAFNIDKNDCEEVVVLCDDIVGWNKFDTKYECQQFCKGI